MKKLLNKIFKYFSCPICNGKMIKTKEKFTCSDCQYEIEI